MAICYNCNEQFYGNSCWHCGELASYPCWFCNLRIEPIECTICKECRWFICPDCDVCGCQVGRPLSNEEKRRDQREDVIENNNRYTGV